MRNPRPSLIGGLALVTLGIIFLLNTIIPVTWPFVLIGLGVFLLVISWVWRLGGLVISGTVNIVLGGILLYQTITGDWESWFYLWPLVFGAVGAGMLLTPRLESRPRHITDMEIAPGVQITGVPGGYGERYWRVSWAWVALAVVGSAVLWLFRSSLEWPSIIWGMGAMFILGALVSRVNPLIIPGTILVGFGLLFAYQNATGDWASWAYAWALIPGFVGLGLFLAFLRSRVMRAVGLSMLGWSLLVFFIFAIFFAREGSFARFWPVVLILAGLVVLGQAMVLPRAARNH